MGLMKISILGLFGQSSWERFGHTMRIAVKNMYVQTFELVYNETSYFI